MLVVPGMQLLFRCRCPEPPQVKVQGLHSVQQLHSAFSIVPAKIKIICYSHYVLRATLRATILGLVWFLHHKSKKDPIFLRT